MIKICFICLGNICRSPMAEYMMKDKVKYLGISEEFIIDSRATSYYEEGNDIYPPAKRVLDNNNINYDKHKATRLEKDDINKYDYFICMDDSNVINTKRIIGDSNRIIKLLDRDVSDPWYTGEFDKTFKDLEEGIELLLLRFR